MYGDSCKFVKTVEISCDGGVRLCKYKSKKTGMTVCIGEADGPLVAGFLCFATEAFDDDGLPHTLEHLVFLGSKKYPYKGVLDLVANRCLASGTNAWTDTDHTCYTMTTAGAEGFLKLLPIYVDHLLYPTLTDSAYTTEIHHINGEGEDAGVVYCEMQARENSGESRCHLAMLRSMYSGHCGYKSEVGGILKNLRESTSNEKVRNYHREFYRPENLCIIIVGQIDATKVFEALDPVEEEIMNEVERPSFVQPWKSPVPPLEKSSIIEMDYPCDEDEYGLVIGSWRGPPAKDYSDLISIQILLGYLTETSVSPLNRDFVEIDDPLCNRIDYDVIENAISCIYLHFFNVPLPKLKEIKDKLYSVLQKIVDGEEAIDMEMMTTVIKKKKLNILSQMESSPHDHLAMGLIGDFLYGDTEEDLAHRVCEIPCIEGLFNKPPEYWVDLLKTYIIKGDHVFVLGRPSKDLSSQMCAEEKQRIKEQQERLGTKGLQEKAFAIKKASKTNEIPPPDEMISSVLVLSVDSIKFHPIQRICNFSSSQDKVDYNIDEMPCRFQLDVINTNFVRTYVLLDTSELSQELRMYLPLFVDLLDECAIKRNGEIICYQDVVKQLAQDTINIAACVGFGYSRFFCGQFAQMLCLELMVEEEKYQNCIQWIHEILYKIVFEKDRVKSSIKKMISDVSSLKRSGGSTVKVIMKNLCFVPESNHWAASMLRQNIFLGGLLKKLESQPEKIIEMLYKVRDAISQPDNMTVHLSLNLNNMKAKVDLEKSWLHHLLPKELPTGLKQKPVKKCHELLRPYNDDCPLGVVTSLGSVHGSFMMQSTPCINSYTHPDYAPLLVLIQYLTQTEGPIWTQVRGPGLAYSYTIDLNPDTGLLFFVISKSSHLVKAYKAVIEIIYSHLNGNCKWEKNLLESGCSSLIYEIIEKLKTVDNVTEESLTAYYRNIDMNYNKLLVAKIPKVTEADLKRVGALYLKPLFDPKQSRCAVCCHPNKLKEIVGGFKGFGRELTVVPSLEDSFIGKM